MMKNNVLKRAAAAVLAVTLICCGTAFPVGDKPLFGSSLTADAAENGCSFNEETGVLTLSGEVGGKDLHKYAYSLDYWGKPMETNRYGMPNTYPVKKVVCKKGTVFSASCSTLFQGFEVAEVIDLSNADTSNVTYFDYLFSGCKNLKTLNISNIDTSNVMGMKEMFSDCSSLISLDLSSFNTSHVTDMSLMFFNCESLAFLDISSFDTSNVSFMNNMFSGCSSLISLDLSNFDTSNVYSMGFMFSECENLTSLNLKSFNTSKVSIMESMFMGCTNLKELDISGFDTSNVRSMEKFLYGCSSLSYIDLSHFDINKRCTLNRNKMFTDCDALKSNIVYALNNNISLGGNIGVNFFIKPGENVAKIVLSGPNGDITFTDFSKLPIVDDQYKLEYPINATQGRKEIILKAYDKENRRLIVCNQDDGLLSHSQASLDMFTYLNRVTNYWRDEDIPLKNLGIALRNYCDAADYYFNDEYHLLDSSYYIPISDLDGYDDEFGSKAKISLVLNTTASVRIYTDGAGVKLDGKAITPKTSKYGKYYEISNIPAHKLLDEHILTVDGKDYKFYPVSYSYRVLHNTPDTHEYHTVTQMARALFVYAQAAKAYLGT